MQMMKSEEFKREDPWIVKTDFLNCRQEDLIPIWDSASILAQESSLSGGTRMDQRQRQAV